MSVIFILKCVKLRHAIHSTALRRKLSAKRSLLLRLSQSGVFLFVFFSFSNLLLFLIHYRLFH